MALERGRVDLSSHSKRMRHASGLKLHQSLIAAREDRANFDHAGLLGSSQSLLGRTQRIDAAISCSSMCQDISCEGVQLLHFEPRLGGSQTVLHGEKPCLDAVWTLVSL